MGNPHEAPEFIEVQIGDQTVFVPFERAVSDPQISGQIVAEALSALRDWNSRYGAFFQRIEQHSAGEVVETIARILDDEQGSTGDGLIVEGK